MQINVCINVLLIIAVCVCGPLMIRVPIVMYQNADLYVAGVLHMPFGP